MCSRRNWRFNNIPGSIPGTYQREVLKMKRTKKEYENYLNEFDVPDHDKKSNGGRVPDKE